MKKLSIIIPHYNTPKLLMKLLDNLVEQQKKYPQTEIIVVDDGSTFGVGWLGRYRTVRVMRQRNMGVSSARNRGLRFATGDYIAFIDADDNVEGNYLERIYCEIAKGGWDYMVIRFRFHSRNESYNGKFRSEQLKNYAVWGYIYRRDCIGNEKFNTNMNIVEDVEWLRRVLKGKKEYILDEVLYHYNWGINPNSLCKLYRKGKLSKYKVSPAS